MGAPDDGGYSPPPNTEPCRTNSGAKGVCQTCGSRGLSPCSVCPPAETYVPDAWEAYNPRTGPTTAHNNKAYLSGGMCGGPCMPSGGSVAHYNDCMQRFTDLQNMLTAAASFADVALAIIKVWGTKGKEIFPGETQPAVHLSGEFYLNALKTSLTAASSMWAAWRNEVFSPSYASISASLALANEYLLALDISANMAMYNAAINEVLHNLCPTIPGQGKSCGPNFMINTAGVKQAQVPLNLLGPQYLTISLEDFTQSRPSSGLIGIAPQNTKLDMPSYASRHSRVFSDAIAGYDQVNDLNASLICDGSSNNFGKGESRFVPTWPRDLTQNQIYSINQILANQKTTRPASRYAPDPRDILAVITLEDNTTAPTRVNHRQIDSKIFTRSYFGPVTIERLGIKLYDDKGNLVNLNGSDWSFTLRAEQLYQY